MPQFARYGSPVFEFYVNTTKYHWNLVLQVWFGSYRGSSEWPGLGWFGSVGEPLALRFQGWTGMYTLVVPSLFTKFIKNSHQNLPV